MPSALQPRALMARTVWGRGALSACCYGSGTWLSVATRYSIGKAEGGGSFSWCHLQLSMDHWAPSLTSSREAVKQEERRESRQGQGNKLW